MDLKNLNQMPASPINNGPELGKTQNEKVWNGIVLAGIVIFAIAGICILIDANQKPSRHKSRSGMPYSESEETQIAADRDLVV